MSNPMPCRHSGKHADRLHDEAYRMGLTTPTTEATAVFLANPVQFDDELREFASDDDGTSESLRVLLEELNNDRCDEMALAYARDAMRLADFLLARIDKYVGAE